MCRTRTETDKVGYKLSTKSHAVANSHRVRQPNIKTDQNFVLIVFYFLFFLLKKHPLLHTNTFLVHLCAKSVWENRPKVHQVRSEEVSARGLKASNATETVLWMNLPTRLLLNFCKNTFSCSQREGFSVKTPSQCMYASCFCLRRQRHHNDSRASKFNNCWKTNSDLTPNIFSKIT